MSGEILTANLHGMRLSTCCLTISKYCSIVTRQHICTNKALLYTATVQTYNTRAVHVFVSDSVGYVSAKN